MTWGIWKMLSRNYKKTESDIKKYLDNCILKPYLIHVEFEILNILTTLELDKIVQKIYTSKGFNWQYLIDTTNQFLYRIKNLIRALET